jgi:hypothetical protein
VSGLHPIVDHALAALALGTPGARYADEDLAALEWALGRLEDEAERVGVHVGLVELCAVLHEGGYAEAVDQLLPVLRAHADAHPELAPPVFGHAGDDRLERGADARAMFGERRPATPPPAGPSFSLLTLQTKH